MKLENDQFGFLFLLKVETLAHWKLQYLLIHFTRSINQLKVFQCGEVIFQETVIFHWSEIERLL